MFCFKLCADAFEIEAFWSYLWYFTGVFIVEDDVSKIGGRKLSSRRYGKRVFRETRRCEDIYTNFLSTRSIERVQIFFNKVNNNLLFRFHNHKLCGVLRQRKQRVVRRRLHERQPISPERLRDTRSAKREGLHFPEEELRNWSWTRQCWSLKIFYLFYTQFLTITFCGSRLFIYTFFFNMKFVQGQ